MGYSGTCPNLVIRILGHDELTNDASVLVSVQSRPQSIRRLVEQAISRLNSESAITKISLLTAHQTLKLELSRA
jgi:hypothetical protein